MVLNCSFDFLTKDYYVASLYDIIGKYWAPTSKDPYLGDAIEDTMPEGSEEVDSEGGEEIVGLSDDESGGDEALAAQLGLNVDGTPYLEPEVSESNPVEDLMAQPVEPPHDSQVPDDTLPVEPLPTEAAQAGESGAPNEKGSGGCGFSPEPAAPPSTEPTDLDVTPSPPPVPTAKAGSVVEIEDSPEPSKGKGPRFEDINAQIQQLKILVCIPGVWFCFNFFFDTVW